LRKTRFAGAALAASVLAVLLAGCALSPTGRPQVMAPEQLADLSAVYSEFDMRLQLVMASDAAACVAAECVADREFDQRIVVLGRRLSEAAYRLHPELTLRFPRFEFFVVDKADVGTASAGSGTVAIYRGLRSLKLQEGALAFVVAREMGHVIAGHHAEDVTSAVLIAVATQIFMPMLGVVRGVATVAAANSATGVSTVLTSAASFAGSRALRASYRPQQVREANLLALRLLAEAGWDGREVTNQLEALGPPTPDDVAWMREFRASVPGLAGLLQGPIAPAPRLNLFPNLHPDAHIVPRRAVGSTSRSKRRVVSSR